MEKKYTQQDLDKFFNQFKAMSSSYGLTKVQELMNKPNAKPKHLVKLKHNLFKIIIMKSIFIIGFTSLIFWLTPNLFINKPNGKDFKANNTSIQINNIDSADKIVTITNSQIYNRNKKLIKPIHGTKIKAESSSFNNTIIATEKQQNNQKSKDNPKTVNNTLVFDSTINKNEKHVEYKDKNITEGIQFLELSKNELIELGFEIKDDEISITPKSKGWKIVLSKQMQGVFRSTFSFKNKSRPKPIFLSNIKGRQMLKWKSFGDNKNKMEDEYFRSTIQELIPILLKQNYFPEILNEDQVFWFEPTIELFESLPERIAVQLEEEYNYITAETIEERIELSNSCTYFEVCKTTMLVENCKLYPNPAKQSTSIEFFVPESIKGSISIANITGVQIRILVPSTSFKKGNNLYKLNLSGINSGIYFVLIQTSNGFKTQRLIISK